ncbi:ribonuclease toxin immunity protein CdiI [Priestia aryabhattai]|uniref:ribonuclease toxin immunity protein CdiI n=1 Tax=Priestia aryabhattai TaxID=412384 RepID=UPI000BF1E0D7|nr:ribonuclease toxin immunity protein CdiI [Priestia aryabhattai]PEI56394.1 hypothetical protein CN635_15505 [Priestia aryabhattai]
MKKIVELFHDIDCTLSPMISFYSALSDQKFLKVLHYFSEETGYGNEYHICTFSGDLEPWEEGYVEKGIEFLDGTGDTDKSVIVDYETFLTYLHKICRVYMEDHAHDKEKVMALLHKIKQNHSNED